jgi:DNA-binding MarR family transcriptional regulator
MKIEVRQLHETLLDLVSLINQPRRDNVLIRKAGVSIDRALFPLLVRIERRGPIGIGELADAVGRDYTTVSRQVAKLESLGLAIRRDSREDRRISEVSVTAQGLAMNKALDAAREKLMWPILEKWSAKDRKSLLTLLRRFTDEATTSGGGED